MTAEADNVDMVAMEINLGNQSVQEKLEKKLILTKVIHPGVQDAGLDAEHVKIDYFLIFFVSFLGFSFDQKN